jgi:hypothetical protein
VPTRQLLQLLDKCALGIVVDVKPHAISIYKTLICHSTLHCDADYQFAHCSICTAVCCLLTDVNGGHRPVLCSAGCGMQLPYTIAVQHIHPESGSCAHRLQRCRLDAVNRRVTVSTHSADSSSSCTTTEQVRTVTVATFCHLCACW